MEQIESVYAVHIVDEKDERVFTSIALLAKEVPGVLKSIKVGKKMKKKVYDICSNKYVNKIL
jgi:hypothetical protein